MNDKQVPQEISALIAYAEEQELKAAQYAEQKHGETAARLEDDRRAETQAFYEEVKEQIPDVIRGYVNLSAWVKEDFGRHLRNKGWNRYLRFEVPGLAPIAMVFEDDEFEDDQCATHVGWIVSGVRDGFVDDESGEYLDASYNMAALDTKAFNVTECQFHQVLLAAAQKAAKLADEESKKPERIARYERRLAQIAESERIQKSIEQDLFDVIKNDAVLMALMQAFVIIRDERSHFEAALNAATGQ